MVKILKKKNKNFSFNFEILLKKREIFDKPIEKKVNNIISLVRKKGDSALLDLTNKFDKLNAKSFNDLVVSEKELLNAYKKTPSKIIKSLKNAIKRVKLFHQKQRPNNLIYRDKQGVTLGSIWNPIDSVGLYVPGGKAAYPSSLIMNVVPAIVAKVPRVVITVPATKGEINPLVLTCCKLLNIQEIYKIGGAQAIAALALGTSNIPVLP